MKVQDILFVIIFFFLLLFRRAQYIWQTGMICLIGSGLLFIMGNLYTAQRMTWYGAAFIAIYTLRSMLPIHYKN